MTLSNNFLYIHILLLCMPYFFIRMSVCCARVKRMRACENALKLLSGITDVCCVLSGREELAEI